MAIPLLEMKPREALYTFVDNEGNNVNIASGRLFTWVEANKTKLETFNVPVDWALGQSFLRNNVVSFDRCLDLALRNDLTPVIFGKDGGQTNGRDDAMLIDGHHRYALTAMMGISIIPAYILEVAQWKPFEVTGLPTITQSRLAALPITKRSY